jgi:hypothetical protein
MPVGPRIPAANSLRRSARSSILKGPNVSIIARYPSLPRDPILLGQIGVYVDRVRGVGPKPLGCS